METNDVPARKARGCGCQAAAGFLLLIALPLLLLFSFSLSPCADGPCDPNGGSRFQTLAIVLAATTVAVGTGTWLLVGWWARRQAARGKDGTRQIEIALTVVLIVAAAALLALFVL